MPAPTIKYWRELLDRYEDFKTGQWCFRGDRCDAGALKTSLERAAVERWGRDWSELPEIEEGLLRRFQREAHLYLSPEPADGDRIGWLSLMRHHGSTSSPTSGPSSPKTRMQSIPTPFRQLSIIPHIPLSYSP